MHIAMTRTNLSCKGDKMIQAKFMAHHLMGAWSALYETSRQAGLSVMT